MQHGGSAHPSQGHRRYCDSLQFGDIADYSVSVTRDQTQTSSRASGSGRPEAHSLVPVRKEQLQSVHKACCRAELKAEDFIGVTFPSRILRVS